MKTTIITGTSTGIGKAIAQHLLGKGEKIIGISRTQTITDANYQHITVDLSNQTALINFEFPTIKTNDIILINNAATIGQITTMGKLSSEKIINEYMINVIAPAILSNKLLSDDIFPNAHKKIVNIGSGAAENPINGWGQYCSSKAALLMLSKVIQNEQSANKVAVYNISPGVVNTPMQETIRKARPEDFSSHQKFIDLKENGELSSPEIVAQKIAYIIANNPNGGEFSVRDVTMSNLT